MTAQSGSDAIAHLTAAQQQFHRLNIGRLMMPMVLIQIDGRVIDIEQADVSFQPPRAEELIGADFELLIVRIRDTMSHLYIRVGDVSARVNRATIDGRRRTSAIGVTEGLGLFVGWKGRVVGISSGNETTEIYVEAVSD